MREPRNPKKPVFLGDFWIFCVLFEFVGIKPNPHQIQTKSTSDALLLATFGPTRLGDMASKLSPAAQAALEKAAKRAAKIADADAGLTELSAKETPKHPSEAKNKALEDAKECSRSVLSGFHVVVCLSWSTIKGITTAAIHILFWTFITQWQAIGAQPSRSKGLTAEWSGESKGTEGQ